MSSADIALILHNTRRTVSAGELKPVTRFALCQGELLRIPRKRHHLHVLSGTAWISSAGSDTVASVGNRVKLVRTWDPALISGLGNQPLLFELW